MVWQWGGHLSSLAVNVVGISCDVGDLYDPLYCCEKKTPHTYKILASFTFDVFKGLPVLIVDYWRAGVCEYA